MSDIGVGLLLFVCLLVAVGLIRFFSWLTELQETHGSLPRAGVNTIRHYVSVRPRNMSTDDVGSLPDRAPVPPVVATFTTAEQSIVTPNNEYNSSLFDNERAAFDTTAKSIAAMYQKGVITNLSKAICAAYGCTVQSATKTDSTYQMALRAVNKYLPDKNAPQFRMTPEQEATREALGLNRA